MIDGWEVDYMSPASMFYWLVPLAMFIVGGMTNV